MANDIDAWVRARASDEPVRLSVGTMNFGRRTPEPEARRIVDRALERGVVLFDTADVYGNGEAERILGRALAGRRDQALIATKVGLSRRNGKPVGLARAAVVEGARASLERLGVARVDLFYLHAPDPVTPIDETLDGIEVLLSQGQIGAWGISNFASWQVLELLVRCDARRIARPVVSQVLYNLLIRQLDIEYWRFARRYAIHTTVYNPLAGGLLTGRHRPGEPEPGSRFSDNALYRGRYYTPRFFELVEAYREIAGAEAVTLPELAYGWLAGCSGVDSILVGPAVVEHLDAAIEGCRRTLSPEVRARIDGVHRAYLGTDARYAR